MEQDLNNNNSDLSNMMLRVELFEKIINCYEWIHEYLEVNTDKVYNTDLFTLKEMNIFKDKIRITKAHVFAGDNKAGGFALMSILTVINSFIGRVWNMIPADRRKLLDTVDGVFFIDPNNYTQEKKTDLEKMVMMVLNIMFGGVSFKDNLDLKIFWDKMYRYVRLIAETLNIFILEAQDQLVKLAAGLKAEEIESPKEEKPTN